MFRRPMICGVIFAAISAVLAGRSFGDDGAAKSVAKPCFTLWTSFGCSRSLSAEKSFSDVGEACEAAWNLRSKSSKKFIFVLEGELDFGVALAHLRAIQADNVKVLRENRQLYVRSVRCRTWGPRKLPDEEIQLLSKSTGPVSAYEFVYRRPVAKTAAEVPPQP